MINRLFERRPGEKYKEWEDRVTVYILAVFGFLLVVTLSALHYHYEEPDFNNLRGAVRASAIRGEKQL